MSSRLYSVFALLAWLCSLCFTGIVLYADQRKLLGIEILGSGWLSLFLLNFAWLANLFFLLALVRIWQRRSAVKYSILAAIFSLDTFRFSTYFLNEAGGHTAVYGYGWGVVLWFLSLYLMTAAAGIRQTEARVASNCPPRADQYEWLKQTGLILCLLTLGTSIFWSIQDHKVANYVERGHLQNIAFKRGPVCGINSFTVVSPIATFSGPLEVRIAKGVSKGNYPFNQITELLSWGIPIIRTDDVDFSYASSRTGPILTSVPASGPVAATLFVTEVKEISGPQIRAKLIEQPEGRIVFDYVWRGEADEETYCPDYQSSPKENQSPRVQIVQALNLSQKRIIPTAEKTKSKRASPNRAVATIISHRSDGKTRDMQGKGLPPTEALNAFINNNCPIGTGWDTRQSVANPSASLNTGWPFLVNGKTFYREGGYLTHAICSGGYVYLYSGKISGEAYYLSLEKRDLSDFSQMWDGVVGIWDKQLVTLDDSIRVDSIEETPDGISLEVTNDITGISAVLTAPLSNKSAF
jgi:hypothetical protein